MRILSESTIEDESQWAFLTSYVRAFEKMLLNEDDYEKLLASNTPDELFKNIEGTSYGKYFSNLQELQKADELLENVYKTILLDIKRLSPQNFIFNYFSIQKDFVKIRRTLKEKVKEDSLDENFSLEGSPLWIMMDEIEVPTEYINATKEIISTFLTENNLQAIDFSCDKETLRLLFRLAETYKNKLIYDFTKSFIELKNLLAIYRIKSMYLKEEIINKTIFPCKEGIEIETYRKLYDTQIGEWENILKPFGYGEIFAEVFEKKETYKIEKKVDQYLLENLSRFRKVSLGIEPTFCFMFLLNTEIQNLNLIITGILNGLPSNIIKERQRLLNV